MVEFPTTRAKIYHARHLYRSGLREPAIVDDQRLTRSGRNVNGLVAVRPKCDAAIAILSRMEVWDFSILHRRSTTPSIISVHRYLLQGELRDYHYKVEALKNAGLAFYDDRSKFKLRTMIAKGDRSKPWYWMYPNIGPKGKLP